MIQISGKLLFRPAGDHKDSNKISKNAIQLRKIGYQRLCISHRSRTPLKEDFFRIFSCLLYIQCLLTRFVYLCKCICPCQECTKLAEHLFTSRAVCKKKWKNFLQKTVISERLLAVFQSYLSWFRQKTKISYIYKV